MSSYIRNHVTTHFTHPYTKFRSKRNVKTTHHATSQRLCLDTRTGFSTTADTSDEFQCFQNHIRPHTHIRIACIGYKSRFMAPQEETFTGSLRATHRCALQVTLSEHSNDALPSTRMAIKARGTSIDTQHRTSAHPCTGSVRQ